jgi:site-specific recombinase XerD
VDLGWQPFERNFTAYLKARNASASTVRIYTRAIAGLGAYLATTEHSPGPTEVTRRDVEAFLRHRLETPHARTGKPIKPATVSVEYRALQQFFKWMLREEEIDRSPWSAPKRPSSRRNRRPSSRSTGCAHCSTAAGETPWWNAATTPSSGC